MLSSKAASPTSPLHSTLREEPLIDTLSWTLSNEGNVRTERGASASCV